MSSPDAGRGRLLVVANFDERGGLQRQLTWLATALVREGPVTVLTWRAGGEPFVESRAEGFNVVRVPSLASWDREHGTWVARANTAVSVVTALTAALALGGRWSTAYAAGLNPEGIVATLAARALGRRAVIGTWLPGPLGNVSRLERSPVAPLLKRVLARADAYVAESGEVADELAAAGFPRRSVHVVPNGVELPPGGSDAGARDEARRTLSLQAANGVVVCCARLDLRQKRFDLLLEGWRRAALDGWVLLLVGEGPDRQEVERLAGGVDPRPRLLGWRDDLGTLLDAADYFVLPTNFEATGLVVLEAMARGRPGLVSAVRAFEHLRPSGVELVPNEAEAWAEALAALARDGRRREELGRAARAWVEPRYDIRRTQAAFGWLLRSGARV